MCAEDSPSPDAGSQKQYLCREVGRGKVFKFASKLRKHEFGLRHLIWGVINDLALEDEIFIHLMVLYLLHPSAPFAHSMT
ncbi:hypothetical protein V6N13_138221 [Hibiscus sabdariffa]|uniref:Uncharacterized protein n=1 Tax=Hibiscus sabdariffa TaxID=183260 RepID=A0ABR2QD54_9ROSI